MEKLLLNRGMLLLIWIAFASVVSFGITLWDKYLAQSKGKKRISEKALFSWALLGGALSMFFAMKVIAHKTKHKRFMIGLPIIICFQAFVAFVLWKKGIISF